MCRHEVDFRLNCGVRGVRPIMPCQHIPVVPPRRLLVAIGGTAMGQRVGYIGALTRLWSAVFITYTATTSAHFFAQAPIPRSLRTTLAFKSLNTRVALLNMPVI